MKAQHVNISGVRISDHFITLDENKINMWQLSLGAVKANKEWSEKSDRAYKKIDESLKQTQVRKHTNINSRTRTEFLRVLKIERERWPRLTYKDLYYQLLAEGKIPKIDDTIMKLKTFMNYCLIIKRQDVDVTTLKQAIIAMYLKGVKSPKTISQRLCVAVSTVRETFREYGVICRR